MTHSNPSANELAAGTARRLAAYAQNGLAEYIRYNLILASDWTAMIPETEFPEIGGKQNE